MQTLKSHILILAIIIFCFVFALPVYAEVKVFEKEVEEAVSRGQSQEQVEAFALQKAKRLAVEEAGTYISSLTVVRNYQLQQDEVTALASGVAFTKVIGIPAVRVENGIVHVKVKARIDVDTNILDRQIQEIMKEKGTLKKLEAEQKKVRELEEKLSNLESSEVKRLEELNAQALVVERERERQRLFREEQALKARGELSKAEADRIAKEREMQMRINRTLAEQEQARRGEAAALAAEQDRIRKASLENEQRWNDLSRRAKLSQESWVAIDDSLSLKQAIEEVKGLKTEIANLKNRLDFQYQANITNLKNAYAQQHTLTGPKLPSSPAPKGKFESSAKYNERLEEYERQVKGAEAQGGEATEMLKKEETLKLAEAKVDYLEQQILVLTPFVERLSSLQARKFTLPEGSTMTVELGDPDPDHSRFPVSLFHNDKSWSTFWNYSDSKSAEDFYNTRTHLKADGLFQIEESIDLKPKLTAAKVTHMGTNETREFALEKPKTFIEINQFAGLKRDEALAKKVRKKAAKMLTIKEIGNDGRFIAYNDGTVLDTRTNLMWAAKDNGQEIKWDEAKTYCKDNRRGGYADWRMPMQDELNTLYRNTKNQHGFRIIDFIEITGIRQWASERDRDGGTGFEFYDGGKKISGLIRSSFYGNLKVLPVRYNDSLTAEYDGQNVEEEKEIISIKVNKILTDCSGAVEILNNSFRLGSGWCFYKIDFPIQAADYSLEFDAKLESGSGYGVWFRGHYSNRVESFGVQFDPGAGGVKFLIYPETESAFYSKRFYCDNNWHHWKMNGKDAQVSVFLDGNLILDRNNIPSLGKDFGFRTWRGKVEVKNLKIKY